MAACTSCAAGLPGRRRICDDCAAEVRRVKERRRNVDPDRPEPGRVRLPAGASTEERFWVKVEKTDSCWLWTGCRNGRGYGHFVAVSGRSPVKAHRYAYELLVGPILDGMQLDHLCGAKACVNPTHLEPVTNEENSRRARERLAVA